MPSFLPLRDSCPQMALKYTSTRGLCVHLQDFFVCMFVKNIKTRTYAEHDIEVPFFGLWKSLLFRKQNQLLPPTLWPLIWKRSVKAEAEGEKSWKPELVSRPVSLALGPGHFSSSSAPGMKAQTLSGFDRPAENSCICDCFFYFYFFTF